MTDRDRETAREIVWTLRSGHQCSDIRCGACADLVAAALRAAREEEREACAKVEEAARKALAQMVAAQFGAGISVEISEWTSDTEYRCPCCNEVTHSPETCAYSRAMEDLSAALAAIRARGG